MSENSSIEWTDTTWNPVTGCTKVSPGCAHCYAETFAERWRGVPGHPYEQGFDLKLWPERLSLPLSWKKSRRVFVNSMSDLFHEDVPFEFIDRVFAVMALTPQHTYQVLTKRPERMREYMAGWVANSEDPHPEKTALDQRWDEARRWLRSVLTAPADRRTMGRWEFVGVMMAFQRWPLPNVWLGTSVELQRWADVRIPELLATPAAVRFLSCEPLLGPLDLTLCGCDAIKPGAHIDWVIVGGESGPGARPFDLAWARSIVDQCRSAGVAVFVKQLGSNPVTTCSVHGVACGGHKWPWNENEAQALGKEPRPKLKSRKGGDPGEWPEDLRVREFPIYDPRYPDGMGIAR